jgi:hypothetical protein
MPVLGVDARTRVVGLRCAPSSSRSCLPRGRARAPQVHPGRLAPATGSTEEAVAFLHVSRHHIRHEEDANATSTRNSLGDAADSGRRSG